MGAAATKAVDELADAPKPQAELRLAVAEQFLLQWRPSRRADTGIWDAEAVCVNRGLLSALDDIVHLKEIEAFPMASAARSRMDSSLRVAMSRLLEEFILLRVWDASGLRCLTGLRFAVEKQRSGSASLAFFTGCSATTEELSLASTSDELYASGGSHSSRPDMVSFVVDGTFFDDLDLICPESLPVLHEIAQRVIRAGYRGELLRAFTKAPCDVMDRFLSIILQFERHSLEADRMSFEEAEWWLTEDMSERWILASKVVAKALVVMKRQLQAQSCGAFERFKNDYFLAIAKQSIFALLRFADGFTSIKSPEKLIYVLEIYQALSNAAPGFLFLFPGDHATLVSGPVTVVLAKLARALRIAVAGLVTKVRTDSSHAESATRGVGVYHLTWYAMTCVKLLAPHRTALDLVLATGDEAEGTEAVTSFGGLVAELIEGLERNLEERSALAGADSEGSAHIFLANNVSYVLNRVADVDVLSLLGEEWATRRRSQLEQHAASYVEACWGPVVACLETGRPAKAMAKFNAAFEEAYGRQVCREVPDPSLRAVLRKSVSEMVVPAYIAFIEKHPKLEKSVRYTADGLAESLSELFEGEAEHGRKI